MAKQPKPKSVAVKKTKVSAPKSTVATKIMNAPGMAFAKGMGYIMNKSEKAGKALRSKIHQATAPEKPKGKKK